MTMNTRSSEIHLNNTSGENLLIVIDGHALIHRSFHAIQQPLTVSSSGEDVRAVYGFINAFIRSLSDWNPSHIVITFDLPSPTFRHEMFDEYKAHRPPTPPELRGQFDRVRQLMSTFKVPIFELKGFEADDLIGTISKQAEELGINTLILTGDSDTLQLVTNKVRVLMSSSVQNRSLYDIQAVRERFGGLGPEFVAEIKALQGDSSDNIPGVPRIGVKTAIKLLTDYGSLEGIYDNLETVKPPGAKKALEENRDLAFRSKILTTIVKEAPIKLDLDSASFGDYNREEVIDFLRELEFLSVIPRLPGTLPPDSDTSVDLGPGQMSLFQQPTTEATKFELATTNENLQRLITEINSVSGFSFDTETTSTDQITCQLVGISFSTEHGTNWYLPIGHNESGQLPKEAVLNSLRPVFEDPNIPVRAHNANFDVTVMEQAGVKVKGLQFDTMIAAHVGGRRNIGLKELALECFGVEMTPITDLIGKGKNQITMAEVPIEKAAPYAAADADFTQKLYGVMKEELENKNISKLFEEVEIPLIPVLVQMQRNGVSLDTKILSEMSITLGGQLQEIQSAMFELVGHEFNLNSPKQLSEILFGELKLPPTRKTRSGFSTDAQSLDDLKGLLDRGESIDSDPRSYEILNRILEHRELSKLKSTYIDALPNMLNVDTGRVHTSYRQTGTTTGRLSSNEPNLQNIPVRSELGRRVREAFIAREGHSLVAADYSQIELRVLAHFSKDPGLTKAFHNGEDVHSATSALVNEIPIEEVKPEMRRIAKILNFGVIYGLSAHGISRQTDLTQKEGKKFIDTYFEKYPGIQKYLDGVKAGCRESGYVETLLGRRRYLPDVNARNFRIRSQAERAAINMPIQGTAADLVKVAMIRIQKRLQESDMQSLMILQVHDELIFEVPDEEIPQLESVLSELMPSSIELDVPVTIEIKKGKDWGTLR
ncbi:MAG: DNA polymerase I [SAR202 cluster bacterium]|nr:DNA polymerase I [SAR202 cluster bacterium]